MSGHRRVSLQTWQIAKLQLSWDVSLVGGEKMTHSIDPAHKVEEDEEVDLCDIDFTEGELTSDEDLPITFGGEA